MFSCSHENKEHEYFPLYVDHEIHTAENTIDRVSVIDKWVEIDSELSISNKVKILLDSISEEYFGEVKLQYLSIETLDDLKILRINMQEKQGLSDDHIYNSNRVWYPYFQGSSGGGNTNTILIETILQKQYAGDWIDAVIFYWNNEPFPFEMDHVKLYSIIMRDSGITRRNDLYQKIINN